MLSCSSSVPTEEGGLENHEIKICRRGTIDHSGSARCSIAETAVSEDETRIVCSSRNMRRAPSDGLSRPRKVAYGECDGQQYRQGYETNRNRKIARVPGTHACCSPLSGPRECGGRRRSIKIRANGAEVSRELEGARGGRGASVLRLGLMIAINRLQ
jgi:hypothetical protein